MTQVLLAAMAQQTMTLQPTDHEPVVRTRAVQRRDNAAKENSLRRGARKSPTRRVESDGYELSAFVRRLADEWDGAEALEVGRDIEQRPGLRSGDVVLVDWTSSGDGARLVVERDSRGRTLVRVTADGTDESAGPLICGSATVVAVVSRVDRAA